MFFPRFAPFYCLTAALVAAQTPSPSAGASLDHLSPTGAQTTASTTGPSVVNLGAFVVTGSPDLSREAVVPNLGATSFSIDRQQIAAMPLGSNAAFSQILLRAPGVAQDSEVNGGIHVRGEHGNLQYRINDILLPEGISGFGSEIDPRCVASLQLITGSLPAQYGFHTAGVVDIHTRQGGSGSGGGLSLMAGSYDTLRPAFAAFGSSDGDSYFINGSYDRNNLGIENPTAGKTALHDATRQHKAFAYVSRALDPTSQISVIASVSASDFQLPNTPGRPAGTSPDGKPWLPGIFDSAQLNETQAEQNDYAVLAYQKSVTDISCQTAIFGRYSGAHFQPDVTGDLFFNGVASEVDRTVSAGGVQFDGRYDASDQHTLRGGLMLLGELLRSHTTTTVFPVNLDGNPTGSPFPIVANSSPHAAFVGFYLQDEWVPRSGLTINYGARFDVFTSTFDAASQLSPRINLIWQPAATTTFHVGYARYFTPPPLENVPAGTMAAFAGTSSAPASSQHDPVKAERADYYDAGIRHTFGQGWSVGFDGYYKTARDQLDDGLFGQTLILSAFNYGQGRIYGLEFTGSYARGGFSSYLNLAHSVAQGKDWTSAQFLFDPADLAYVRTHWIYLDHDQALSGSFGAAYAWKYDRSSTQAYFNAVYGSGLRHDTSDAFGASIPNGGTLPAYATVSLGVAQRFPAGPRAAWLLRLDLVNLTDEVYELHDGTGVGVNAAQYGHRRGIFGTVAYLF